MWAIASDLIQHDVIWCQKIQVLPVVLMNKKWAINAILVKLTEYMLKLSFFENS